MPSRGYIVARAFTSNAQIPVEDATVTITQKLPSNITELLAVRLTDDSGKTERLPIQTPDLSISLAPNSQSPAALVDITAEHPRYERIVVEDVQVFPETVTLQDLQLIPLDEMPERWDETEIFNVPPQDL